MNSTRFQNQQSREF